MDGFSKGDQAMSDRKAKLEKALAPSLPNDKIRFADMAWGIQCHADRLAPLHAALVCAVEALEGMNDHVCDGGGDFPCSQMWFQDVAREALAKIDEAINQQTKNSNS